MTYTFNSFVAQQLFNYALQIFIRIYLPASYLSRLSLRSALFRHISKSSGLIRSRIGVNHSWILFPRVY